VLNVPSLTFRTGWKLPLRSGVVVAALDVSTIFVARDEQYFGISTPLAHPLLNVAAFDPVSAFNFYTGYGRITQNIRQPRYSDFDFGLKKVFRLRGRVTFELRGGAFNILNAPHFNQIHSQSGDSAFVTDFASHSFGMENGPCPPEIGRSPDEFRSNIEC
jgi:hypothetical protein